MSEHIAVTQEARDALQVLEAFIGTGDYVTTSTNKRGHLHVTMGLQGWSGISGWRLYLRCVGLAWRLFRGRMWATWVTRD
jgi:hypothetical protein